MLVRRGSGGVLSSTAAASRWCLPGWQACGVALTVKPLVERIVLVRFDFGGMTAQMPRWLRSSRIIGILGLVGDEGVWCPLRQLDQGFVAFSDDFGHAARYRSGGEQRMTAPHVSVSQAIVANVTPAPREIAPNETAASPPPLADSRTPPMTILHEPALATAQLTRGPSK